MLHLQSEEGSRKRALTRCFFECGAIEKWPSMTFVERYRESRLQSVLPTIPDFRDSLCVISFGARDGGFELSQEIRRWMQEYLGWSNDLIYHDYASLIDHPMSSVVVGDDGVSRQLNVNWNVYFANALSVSPVIIFIVSEAWCKSPWCALERRQRMESLMAKQVVDGPAGYTCTSMSNPESAKAVEDSHDPASVYYSRQLELEELLADFKDQKGLYTSDFSDVKESIFRGVAFGQKRGEIFLFTDDPLGPNASKTLRMVHDSISENQRFYFLPKIVTKIECELELHSMCVRVVEVIEEQTNIESVGSGSRFHENLFKGVVLRANEDGSQTATHNSDFNFESVTESNSFLQPLHDLTKSNESRAALQEEEAFEAELTKGCFDAIGRGLLFDSGPCPF